jgi:hypothetical protein
LRSGAHDAKCCRQELILTGKGDSRIAEMSMAGSDRGRVKKYLRSDLEWRDEAICGGRGSSAVAINAGLDLLHPAWILLGVKFLSRLLTVLNLLPSIATIASENRSSGGTCGTTPLLAAATGLHAWLGGDGSSATATGLAAAPAHRSARPWCGFGCSSVCCAPMPLTGDRALPTDTPWRRDTWMPAFLMALADEAADGLDRLVAMDRAAPRAVAGLDMGVKNATQLLCLLRRRPGATGAWPCVACD